MFDFLAPLLNWFNEITNKIVDVFESMLIFALELFPLHGDSIPNFPDPPVDGSIVAQLWNAVSWVLPVQFCLNVALAMAGFHVSMFVVNIVLRWLKAIPS